MGTESETNRQSQEKLRKSLPECTLALNFLEKLHEPDEITELIRERHGLNEKDLFLHVADSGTSMDVFDRVVLLKFALMRLECVDYKTIADFYNYEIDKSKDKNGLQTLWGGSNRYFSESLREKIKNNFESIDFVFTRYMYEPNLQESITKLIKLVGATSFTDLFKRILTFSERVADQNRFSFPEMLKAFTLRVVDGLEFDSLFERMEKVDTQKNRNRLKRMWLYYMSTKCLDFLPQNIAKIKHGFREKT